jgi:hypothetical protein
VKKGIDVTDAVVVGMLDTGGEMGIIESRARGYVSVVRELEEVLGVYD